MHRSSHLLRIPPALAAVLAAGAFLAAPVAGAQTADERYSAEVARCNAGQTQQDRATCLREAGAARDEARKGNLNTPAVTDAARNATDRCKAQPVADQAACLQRIEGSGSTTTSGSVAGGGVIRETVTPVKP